MMKQHNLVRSMMLGAALCMGSLTACSGTSGETATATEESAPALDPILASPQVGDLWSGELTHFSAANFNRDGGESMTAAYGMMRVVDVTDDKVTVITEQGAYPSSDPAVAELNSGSLSNVTWDESERIPVNRSELQQLVTDGKLKAWRRP